MLGRPGTVGSYCLIFNRDCVKMFANRYYRVESCRTQCVAEKSSRRARKNPAYRSSSLVHRPVAMRALRALLFILSTRKLYLFLYCFSHRSSSGETGLAPSESYHNGGLNLSHCRPSRAPSSFLLKQSPRPSPIRSFNSRRRIVCWITNKPCSKSIKDLSREDF